jgi:hypothetical protein
VGVYLAPSLVVKKEKHMRLLASMMLLFAFQIARAHDHVHAKHNMVLFGENEVFASHLVYKAPHNYQVILSLSLSAEDKGKYLAARCEHPTEQLIFLLDEMDIKDIATQRVISGPVFYRGADGERHEVIPNMRITQESFKVVFFNELPLSLSP